VLLPSVLWHHRLGIKKSIWPVEKLCDEVLADWCEVQMICISSSWCHCHPIISCFIEIPIGLTFLVPAYPNCPRIEAVKRESVWFVKSVLMMLSWSLYFYDDKLWFFVISYDCRITILAVSGCDSFHVYLLLQSLRPAASRRFSWVSVARWNTTAKLPSVSVRLSSWRQLMERGRFCRIATGHAIDQCCELRCACPPADNS